MRLTVSLDKGPHCHSHYWIQPLSNKFEPQPAEIVSILCIACNSNSEYCILIFRCVLEYKLATVHWHQQDGHKHNYVRSCKCHTPLAGQLEDACCLASFSLHSNKQTIKGGNASGETIHQLALIKHRPKHLTTGYLCLSFGQQLHSAALSFPCKPQGRV